MKFKLWSWLVTHYNLFQRIVFIQLFIQVHTPKRCQHCQKFFIFLKNIVIKIKYKEYYMLHHHILIMLHTIVCRCMVKKISVIYMMGIIRSACTSCLDSMAPFSMKMHWSTSGHDVCIQIILRFNLFATVIVYWFRYSIIMQEMDRWTWHICTMQYYYTSFVVIIVRAVYLSEDSVLSSVSIIYFL